MTLNGWARWSMRSRLRAARASDGFSMIELMVSILVFGVLSTAVLTTLNMTIGLTRADRNRVAASNLAARELEIVRRDFTSAVKGPQTITLNQVVDPTPLPGGTVGQPLVVDSVGYTLTRVAQWTTAGDTAPASACDNGSNAELTVLKVHVEVTWPHMGSVAPVVADTLMAPRKGTYSTATGYVAVKILDRNGVGSANRSVSVNGPGGTQTGNSASDGCVLFPFLAVGSYAVSVHNAGYVDEQGATTPTVTASVSAAEIWKGTFDYDLAATINATFVVTDASYPLPSVIDMGLSLGNSGLLPDGSVTKDGVGVTRTITGLWPYSGGYQPWAGRCVDADPAANGVDSRAGAVSVSPGATTNANVDLGELVVGVAKGAAAASGQLVWALHVPDTSCPASSTFYGFGDLVQLGTTNASGLLYRSLPYGTWTIYAYGQNPASGTWPTITSRRGQPAVGVGVIIK